MAKIILREPEGPYSCILDTEAMDVILKEVFVGVSFETTHGQKLSVCMRDDGFEVHYYGDYGRRSFDTKWTEFKNGEIKPHT